MAEVERLKLVGFIDVDDLVSAEPLTEVWMHVVGLALSMGVEPHGELTGSSTCDFRRETTVLRWKLLLDTEQSARKVLCPACRGFGEHCEYCHGDAYVDRPLTLTDIDAQPLLDSDEVRHTIAQLSDGSLTIDPGAKRL